MLESGLLVLFEIIKKVRFLVMKEIVSLWLLCGNGHAIVWLSNQLIVEFHIEASDINQGWVLFFLFLFVIVSKYGCWGDAQDSKKKLLDPIESLDLLGSKEDMLVIVPKEVFKIQHKMFS